jgi:two-component system C4-dicarboxylate transport sensor histidine kinase DctB
MAYAELVSLETTLTDEARRMLNQIVGAVRKSSTLINNLTDIARKERPDIRIVDPQNLVDRVLGLRHYDLQVSHVNCQTTCDPGLGSIMADLPKVEQALIYLLSNAIEAVSGLPDKRIDVAIVNHGDSIGIAVRDSAPEIPEADRDRIFQPFYTTKGADHLGLGLPIARAVAQDHDGSLVYDSQSGFIMRLPRINRHTDGVTTA